MSDHIKEIAKVLVGRGFTPVAAAGIIGNAYQESGWNPASVGDGGGGLWGFTAGAISLASLQAYAHAKNESWDSATTQANFLADHVDSQTKTTLNSIKDPTKAAQYFMENWERPLVATENLARRQQGASIAYKQIMGTNLKTTAKGRATGGSTKLTSSSTAPSSTSTTVSSAHSAALAAIGQLLAAPAATTSAGPSVSVPIVTKVAYS